MTVDDEGEPTIVVASLSVRLQLSGIEAQLRVASLVSVRPVYPRL